MEKEEMLTAKKVAEKLGVTEAKVKKIIKEQNIEPDAKRGACNYYAPATVEKNKSLID
ncbi:MAG TPA: hypothetical protein PLU67_02910 [Candidatus Kapabacteria bacterium]|nr:hypothetical protein [Candidatus Kapabacteria bacterium]HOM04426.1 hypothetical protein [Candidatus Kapabacteria bacterium]HPP39993.1 hypothetical protein [Candidatus Kapabacteria bacterium]